MLAVTRQELLRHNLARYIARESQDTLHLHRKAVFGSGDAHTCELELLRGDGSRLPVQLDCNQIKDPGSEARQCRAVLLDISRRWKAEEQLKQTVRQLQGMTQRLVQSQELERHRIARELHDQIGQALTAIQLNLQAVLSRPDGEEVIHRVGDSLRLVDELAQQAQDMSLSLRPSLLDDLGLPAALRWLIDHLGTRAGLRTEFRVEPLESRLDPDIETACFRVAQEALTNVVRHARAGRVTIQLQTVETSVVLTVQDDGCGFDVDSVRGGEGSGGRLGLLGMDERVALVDGRLEIRSGIGRGTSVTARVPLTWRSRDRVAREE
jgi:signal transduction histidine kinase